MAFDKSDHKKSEKYLYLDGLLNLNEGDLKYLNFYIARIPAELTRPKNALIIGNGTLSSAPVVYPFSKRLTSVELDPGVLNAGKRFFTSEDKLTPLKNWRFHLMAILVLLDNLNY